MAARLLVGNVVWFSSGDWNRVARRFFGDEELRAPLGALEQIVGREPSQRACRSQDLNAYVVDRGRVNSTVGRFTLTW